ncbi:hypothetical protein P2P98_03255 [Microbacterium sp. Kw_RZR3]|uniref:hypothetical protein n=1 Tax=Microbacterium sp. Kw_RZR3 TaxID=3032903 RepID=UPI0023DB1A06|nr:hypothetical protein [Microbacterium sp. Kw_RZR3]MDF2045167.1 hypothetical protein [Microbacterium sp. Kw_RZR3]
MSTTTGRVPLLEPETGRFPDKYTPQGALDAAVAAEGARDDAEGFAQDAQNAAASIAKGQPNGVGSLDASGKQPEAQVPERLSTSQLSSTFVAVRTSDGKALPAGTIVVITLDKTLAQVTATPVADIADITFQQTGA